MYTTYILMINNHIALMKKKQEKFFPLFGITAK